MPLSRKHSAFALLIRRLSGADSFGRLIFSELRSDDFILPPNRAATSWIRSRGAANNAPLAALCSSALLSAEAHRKELRVELKEDQVCCKLELFS